jgi:hypothetical protein
MSTGNGGARLTQNPTGPDGAPIDAKGLILVDSNGNPMPLLLSGAVMAVKTFALGSAVSIPTGTSIVSTSGYSAAGDGGGALYVFDAAIDAAYVTANPLISFRSINGRGFRLSEKQQLNIRMFGATGDGVTLDYPSFLAAHNYIGPFSRAGYGYNVGVSSLFIPFGVYNLAGNAFDLLYPIHLRGEGAGTGGDSASVLKWNNTSSGIRVQYVDTVGDTGTQAAAAHSGASAIIEGLHLEGGFDNLNEAERQAIVVRAVATIRDCNLFNWAGDGLHIFASSVGAAKGNANCTIVQDVFAQNCRSGISVSGNEDTNACIIRNFNGNGNRRWGIEDRGFLGNHYIGGHHDANARQAWNTGAAGRPVSYVSQGGNQYFVIDGQDVGASTNAPSGTTADNTWWGFYAVGGVAGAIPAWFNGIAVRSGGHILGSGLNNASTFYGIHVEGNAFSQFGQYCFVCSSLALGLTSALVSGSALSRNKLGGIWSQAGGITIGGNVIAKSDLLAQSANNVLGPQTGATVQDGTTIFGSRSTGHGLTFNTYDSAGNIVSNYATLAFGTGFGASFDMTSAGSFSRFKIGGNERFKVDATGAIITGGTLQFGAVTSINASGVLQAAAFPALTGDVTTVAGALGATIAANAVSYAKFVQPTANSLVGNPTGSTANAQNITLAGGLAFSGTTLTAAGALTPTSVASSGNVTSSAGVVGYATGAGGTIAQITSKATAVTLNKVCGQFTTNNAALAAAGVVTFQVNDSNILATDTVNLNLQSGQATTGTYRYWIEKVAAGSFQVSIENRSAGSLSEALVFNYATIRTVNA